MEPTLNSQTVYAVKCGYSWYNGYLNLEHAQAHKAHFDQLMPPENTVIHTFEPGSLKQSAYGSSYLPVEIEEDPLANEKFPILSELRI